MSKPDEVPKPRNLKVASASAWTLEWIPIAKLERDPTINRELDEKRAERIAADFDPDHVGLITVSLRKDGTTIIIDGQHRVQGMRIMGWADQKAPCKVYRGLSKADEAALFLALNDFKAVKFIDKFIVRVNAKEPVAVAIDEIVHAAGYAISRVPKDGVITSAKALENVYLGRWQRIRGENPEALRNTLGVVTVAWGRTVQSVLGHVIEGVGAFFLRYVTVDKKYLATRLAGVKGGPLGLVNFGKGKQEYHGGSLPAGIAWWIVDDYNKMKRGKNALPGWLDV